MKSFRQFIQESALQRKVENGNGAVPIDIPDTKIIHHDPAKKVTIYHALSPKACYTLGSGTHSCTSTQRREFAHGYLRKGNLFVIHHGKERYQHYIAHAENRFDETSHITQRRLTNLVGKETMQKMRDLPHATAHIPKWEDDPDIKKHISYRESDGRLQWDGKAYGE